MDAGPIVAQRETPIGPEETTPELTARLVEMGAGLLLDILPGWRRGDIRPREQDESRATHDSPPCPETTAGSTGAGRRKRLRGESGPTTRGRARSHTGGGRCSRCQAVSVLANPPRAAGPGEVVPIPGGIRIGTGDDLIAPGSLQIEGRRAVEPAEFARGYRDFVGTTLGE